MLATHSAIVPSFFLWKALWQEESQIEIDANAGKKLRRNAEELMRCGFFEAAHPNCRRAIVQIERCPDRIAFSID